ncbi:hypothetical protein [Succinatimonas hippei]|uniref:hypothetical protein n=1 Tax=Succinatimonas hippei TaxID=626938 RepID=UPI00255D031A|nr:hypothetical protein [Succinatimonas hippei]
MNYSDLMDFYLDKARRDSALEALERVKAAIEERIESRDEHQITVYDALRIAESFVSVARVRSHEAENSYIDAISQTFKDASAEKEEHELKRTAYL